MFVCPRAEAQAQAPHMHSDWIGFECTTEDEYTGQVSLLLVLMRWKCQLCIKVQETQALLSVVIKNLTVVSQAKDFQSISFDAWIFIAEKKENWIIHDFVYGDVSFPFQLNHRLKGLLT